MKKRKKKNKNSWTSAYQYDVGTREGFKIEMTRSLTLSSPTIQFSTILCRFQCSHMLRFIKPKINKKESQKKKNAKEKLASGGEDETKKKSKDAWVSHLKVSHMLGFT